MFERRPTETIAASLFEAKAAVARELTGRSFATFDIRTGLSIIVLPDESIGEGLRLFANALGRVN